MSNSMYDVYDCENDFVTPIWVFGEENVNFDLAAEAGVIHKMFNGLQWITASYSNDPEKEIKKIIEIKDYINSDTSKKIIISDYQFFSAMRRLIQRHLPMTVTSHTQLPEH